MDDVTTLELVRWTARLSLVLFCAAFAAEASSAIKSVKRRLYQAFVAAQWVHLSTVAVHYVSLGHPPAMSLVLVLLGVGVVVLVDVSRRALTDVESTAESVIPAWQAWFLWLLFAGSHAKRVVDPTRSKTMAFVFLGIAVAAGAIRILLGRKRR